MKVLVTGGAGFIGSHIVDLLIREGMEVAIVDNLATGLMCNVNPLATFYQMDIRDERLKELLMAERFDYVIHEAAQTTVAHSLEEPYYDCDVNLLGLVNLLEASRLSGVKRIVFASSAAIYGDVEKLPIREDHLKNPLSFYGESKLTGERYLELYYKNFGLEYVVLRYANVYGSRQGLGGEGGVVSIFWKRLVAGEGVTIYGDGQQTRDFVYVKDVAMANWRALFTSCANRSYNISTMKETCIKDVATMLAQTMGKENMVTYAPARESEIHRSVLDNRMASEGLNWTPQYTLQDGLESMCADSGIKREKEAEGRSCYRKRRYMQCC